MTSLLLNFLRRAILVPVLLTAVVIFSVYTVVPKYVYSGNKDEVETESVVDLSSYNTKDYASFKNLKSGDYVGTVECPSVGMNKTPIIFSEERKGVASLCKDSKDPWNKGAFAIATNDTKCEIGKLYNSKIGDEITVEFYSKGEYTYKLEKVIVGKTKKDINSYIKDSKLVICVPFNDFSDLNNSYYYTFYIAGK